MVWEFSSKIMGALRSQTQLSVIIISVFSFRKSDPLSLPFGIITLPEIQHGVLRAWPVTFSMLDSITGEARSDLQLPPTPPETVMPLRATSTTHPGGTEPTWICL